MQYLKRYHFFVLGFLIFSYFIFSDYFLKNLLLFLIITFELNLIRLIQIDGELEQS